MIQAFDHLEFYVGNAKQAAMFYTQCFGFRITAYRGLETGDRHTTSYVLEQGQIRWVLTSALSPDHAIAQQVLQHSDHVAVLGFTVADVKTVHQWATAQGAVEALSPVQQCDEQGKFWYSEIQVFGNVRIRLVDRTLYNGVFSPGFHPRPMQNSRFHLPFPLLHVIDHVVANVEEGAMDRWVQFFEAALGLKLLAHFDDRAISTEYSALMSKVVQNASGTVKLPINEPARGDRKSQIEEYLDYHRGAGIQHIALRTDNIIETVRHLQQLGVEFLQVPATYYDQWAAQSTTLKEPLHQLAACSILVDQDRDGYLLQTFTQTVQDRPTLFFEIIQRCGAQGFGEGNFKALFEAVEREQALRGNL